LIDSFWFQFLNYSKYKLIQISKTIFNLIVGPRTSFKGVYICLQLLYKCVLSDRNREGFWPAPSTVEFGEFYRLCYNTAVCLHGTFPKAAKGKLLSEQIIFLCSLAGGVKIYVTGLVWYASFIIMGTCAACAKSENAPYENNTVEVFLS